MILLFNIQSSILSIERRLNFCQLLSLISASVVCLTEAWLDDSVSDSGVLAGHPYTVVPRSDQTAGHHGGLLVAMRNAFLGTISLIYYSKCEQFCVLVLSNQILTLCIILAYLPPRGSLFYVKPGVTEDKLRNTLANVEASLSCDQRKAVQWILLGDFNFPKVRWESPNSDEQKLLELLCNDLLLTQIIDLHTHKLGSILDLIFCSHAVKWDFNIVEQLCSDHYPILLTNVDLDYQYASGHAYTISSFNEADFSSHLTLSRSFGQECHNRNPDFL